MIVTSEEVHNALNSNNDAQVSWVSDGVSIDSRSIKSGNLFVAIKGSNFDGHNFLHEVSTKGAAAAIVSEKIDVDIPLVVVSDTLHALQELAKYKRVHSLAKMIAVTGSAGKTTTKEMIYEALSVHGVTYRNAGNLNNHIGLPLSLLNMPDDSEYVILEMGMNHAGEIEVLTNIMQPNLALITNVGPAHLEHFSSIEDIAKAKAEIFLGTVGAAVLNMDNEYYDHLYSIARTYPKIDKVIGVGKGANSDVRLVQHNSGQVTICINNKQKFEYRLSTAGDHIVQNSLLALGVIHALGLGIQKSADNLQFLHPQDGRGKIHHVQNMRVIDDTYNANPLSVKAALSLLSRFKGRRIAILGDMLELGERSRELHESLANEIHHYKIDKVFTVGENMKYLYEALDSDVQGEHFHSSKEVDLVSDLKENDTLLVKGSRGIKMEIVLKKLLFNV